jgi:hypothetical protein
MRRIEEFVFALDALADRTAADAARELLQGVLQLHGVLLLHGLHPADFEVRVLGKTVNLRLGLAKAGTYRSVDAEAIGREVRQTLLDAAPDAAAVEIEGPPANRTFVPVSRIARGRKPRNSADAPG